MTIEVHAVPPMKVDAADAKGTLPCLAGGGEMGALIRSMDWSQTALGPVERWPQSSRTSVGTCLHSRFPILIWWGPELCKIYNDAYRPILGEKHPKSMGQRGHECWPEIWHLIGPMLHGVLERGEATWSENQMLPLERHGYPEECYFTFSYSPIHDETDRVGGVFCAVTETTRQVLGERRLRTLRTVAAHASEGRTDAEACRRACATLAANPEDIPFAMLYLCSRDGRAASLAASCGSPCEPFPEQVILSDSGSPWPASLSPQASIVLAFGPPASPSGFLVAGLSARLPFDDEYRGFLESLAGQLGTAVANARALDDATERAEQLSALDRAKTTFFSNVSHELRTPLTLMLGPLEDALTEPPHALCGEALRSTHRNTMRLLKLVNGLLDFSRIEAGRMQARFEPVALAAFTRDIASSFRSTIENAGLAFHVDCEGEEVVHVDRDMWEKIVLNLLSNAFKFTLEGEIRLWLGATDEGVRLEVRDTGSGIAPEDMGRLFRRFERIEGTRARTQEGTGIGLALIQELVHMHGGEIGVASESGRGSAFFVTLRRGTAHLPADRIAPAGEAAGLARAAAFIEEAEGWARADRIVLAAPEAEAVTTGRQKRILVADDNLDMREYIARLLSPHGAVECVADGERALAALDRAAFDLVITDVMMPNLDGFGLLAAIRAREDTRTLPVVMLSARAGEEARIEGLDAGADDYLVKPFGGRELVARVRSQLELKRAREEIALERLTLEERERNALREARLQKEHLESLLMQAPTPMCILRGRDYVVELANDEVCRVWRRTREQVLDRPLLEVLPELRDQRYVRLLDQVMDSGIPYVGREEPARIDVPGGACAEVFFDFVYAPLRNAEGEVEGILVLAFDITHEVRARRELGSLRAEAEAANRAKDEFLAMLGHELRNPLAPIVTALQLMRLRGMESREQDVIERQVTALGRLVDDLLDVSRITRGSIELRTRVLEVGEIVARAIETASPLIEKRGHRLRIDVPAAGLAVSADPARMAQVVFNLLTNAAKYSAAGSEIALAARASDGRVRLCVKDEGIGIAADMLDKVFEPFTQQRQGIERSAGGLGLGLAIVRNIVKLHGGTVSVQSAVGRGSEFVITLPLCAAPSGVSEPDARPALPAESSRARVLVVDDNEDAGLLMHDLLASLGYRVRVAHDGPAALALAATFVPDVAILDIAMPVMDGYELGERLRERLGEGVKLVALTGFSQSADHERSRAAGFAGHLVKPMDSAAITALLRELTGPSVA